MKTKIFIAVVFIIGVTSIPATSKDVRFNNLDPLESKFVEWSIDLSLADKTIREANEILKK